MRIIGPEIAALAAEMLNIEHGQQLFRASADGLTIEPLAKEDPRHGAPAIVISCPPVTEGAPPLVVHYKPTVGVVYCAASRKFDMMRAAHQVHEFLKPHEGHLTGYRVMGVTGQATLRMKGIIHGGGTVVGPCQPYLKKRGQQLYAARSLLHLPAHQSELADLVLPRVSYTASFTWIFANATISLELSQGGVNMNRFNALAAGIVYDHGSRMSAETRELWTADPLRTPTPADFGITHIERSTTLTTMLAQANLAIVIDGGRLRVMGMPCPVARGWAPLDDRTIAELPKDVRVAQLLPGVKAECTICRGPLWGRAYAIVGSFHSDSHPSGDWLEGIAGACCRYCAAALVQRPHVMPCVHSPLAK